MAYGNLDVTEHGDVLKNEINQSPMHILPGDEGIKRILVVDDERDIRYILTALLSKMGYEVLVASNGEEALIQFTNSPFSLVLTDWKMPGIDGFTLAKRIKNQSPHTPVILVTGESEEDAMEKIKDGPVESVIFKPFSTLEIQRTLNKVLKKSAIQEDV